MVSAGEMAVDRRRSVARLVATVVAAVVAAGSMIVGEGAAQAFSAYVECPDLRPGARCGFEGAVGPGSVIVAYHYRKTDGGYDNEIYVEPCQRASCQVYFAEVPRPDRIPAGYEVSSDSIMTVIAREP